MQEPFGPNWMIMILPYTEQAALYNSSNVNGYPGWAATSTPNVNTAPGATNYNLDWANTTVRTTRLNVMVCPSDPNNRPDNNFYQASDYSKYPSSRPSTTRDSWR